MQYGKDRYTLSASCTGPVNDVSYSSNVVSSTGIALEWIGATNAFGAVVRQANNSCSTSVLARVHMSIETAVAVGGRPALMARLAKSLPY